MPKTRTDMERAEKVEAILNAAERRVADRGFEGLSMAGIARDLGLAQAAIYWYFPSKDHLFAAVLRRILERSMSKKMKSGLGLKESIIWFTEQLGALATLRPAIQERASHSEVVAGFVSELYATLRSMLRGAFGSYVPESELEIAVTTFISTVEGTYVTGATSKERRKVLEFVLDKMIG